MSFDRTFDLRSSRAARVLFRVVLVMGILSTFLGLPLLLAWGLVWLVTHVRFI